MLVLSRRTSEDVVLPELQVVVRVLRATAGRVRLGIVAPEHVRVVRGELAEAQGQVEHVQHKLERPDSANRHHLRNRLNLLTLGLNLMQQLLAAEQYDQAASTLERLLRVADELADATVNGPAQAVTQLSPSLAGRRVLVVEDNDNEREMLAGLLRLQGFDAVTAADGLEALSYLASNDPPNLILLDMRMPRCDGPTMLQQIQANPIHANTQIFAISGLPEEDSSTVTSTSRGVTQWFQKPVNPQKLIDSMRAALN